MNYSQDAKESHMKSIFSFKILGICLGLLGIILIAMIVFKVSAGSILFAAVLLACPLMHFLMMKGGRHDH